MPKKQRTVKNFMMMKTDLRFLWMINSMDFGIPRSGLCGFLIMMHIVWKLAKMSHLNILIFGIVYQFFTQVVKNSPNWLFFGFFYWTFAFQNCKRSSLRSQSRMRTFSVIFKHCVVYKPYVCNKKYIFQSSNQLDRNFLHF